MYGRYHKWKRKLYYYCLNPLAGAITHVRTTKPIAALTFDDGPHPVYTAAFLELLARYEIHGTFFTVGEAAQMYPDLIVQMQKAGHVIGSHSWDHSMFTNLSWRERRDQLRRWENVVGVQNIRLFRLPWGRQNVASHLVVKLMGYEVIAWNVAVQDWLEATPEQIAERLISRIKPGSIILLHDAIYHSLMEKPQYNRCFAIEGLKLALPHLCERFQFVTVPELLQYGRPVTKVWTKG